jgi:uncharacterized protein
MTSKTVAVIGASSQRTKFGNKALRAFRHAGYRVVPINPTETTVEGEKAYPTVLDYPGDIDEATMYVHPRVGMRVLDEIAQKGIKVVWFNPGADAPDVVKRAEALGLMPLVACSIIGIGESPSRY